MNLTAESFGIDSEHQLLRVIPDSLGSKIERSVYNHRRRKLFFVKERIRKAMSNKFTGILNAPRVNFNIFLFPNNSRRTIATHPEQSIPFCLFR